eukprot:m.5784 g.5784  ORF g.5784 m.5784 type:complete len:56 (+) comp5087_c0_seq1:275-442(+)
MGYLGDLWLTYNVNTSLYMLEPWERVLFNSAVIAAAAFLAYGTQTFLLPWITHFV